jgi:hypothetical protein
MDRADRSLFSECDFRQPATAIRLVVLGWVFLMPPIAILVGLALLGWVLDGFRQGTSPN